jgi:hypothetical protein
MDLLPTHDLDVLSPLDTSVNASLYQSINVSINYAARKSGIVELNPTQGMDALE